jgi:hypothetical protein
MTGAAQGRHPRRGGMTATAGPAAPANPRGYLTDTARGSAPDDLLAGLFQVQGSRWYGSPCC